MTIYNNLINVVNLKENISIKDIEITEPKEKNTSLVEITIHEGRNRQIRKMIEAVGKKVIKLKRERYAFLDLSGLKASEYRKLSNKEIAVLYSLVK